MNSKHRKTFKKIFDLPIRSDIEWIEIENLLIYLGAELSEGSGSRIRIALHNVRAVFHRPHPKKEANKGTINSLKRFLQEAGIKSDEI